MWQWCIEWQSSEWSTFAFDSFAFDSPDRSLFSCTHLRHTLASPAPTCTSYLNLSNTTLVTSNVLWFFRSLLSSLEVRAALFSRQLLQQYRSDLKLPAVADFARREYG